MLQGHDRPLLSQQLSRRDNKQGARNMHYANERMNCLHTHFGVEGGCETN